MVATLRFYILSQRTRYLTKKIVCKVTTAKLSINLSTELNIRVGSVINKH